MYFFNGDKKVYLEHDIVSKQFRKDFDNFELTTKVDNQTIKITITPLPQNHIIAYDSWKIRLDKIIYLKNDNGKMIELGHYRTIEDKIDRVQQQLVNEHMKIIEEMKNGKSLEDIKERWKTLCKIEFTLL